jgi:hypothetical protein
MKRKTKKEFKGDDSKISKSLGFYLMLRDVGMKWQTLSIDN